VRLLQPNYGVTCKVSFLQLGVDKVFLLELCAIPSVYLSKIQKRIHKNHCLYINHEVKLEWYICQFTNLWKTHKITSKTGKKNLWLMFSNSTYTHNNGTIFNKPRCQILHLGWSNAGHKYKIGEEWLDSRPAESDLGELVSHRLNRN